MIVFAILRNGIHKNTNIFVLDIRIRCYINIPLQIYQGINVSSFWSRRCCNMLHCYPLCGNIAGIFCELWYAVMLFTLKLWKEAIDLGAEEFLELVFCDSVARAECIANSSLPIVVPSVAEVFLMWMAMTKWVYWIWKHQWPQTQEIPGGFSLEQKWTLSNNPMPAPDKKIVPTSEAFHAAHFIGSFGD